MFAAFLVVNFIVSDGNFVVWAQSASSLDGGALFVPDDLDSPNVFSSVDAARRNRPPKPSKAREELYYPQDFLTLSAPIPEETATETVYQNDKEKSEPEEIPRKLDPSAETTPFSPPPEPEPPKQERGDQIFFFAASIALAVLGVFVYFDIKHKKQLKEDLAKNVRLCSPNAVAADFEDVLAQDGDSELATYVDPSIDDSFLLFEDVRDVNGEFQKHDFFVAKTDLHEENFDFVPRDNLISLADGAQDDFVVAGRDKEE